MPPMYVPIPIFINGGGGELSGAGAIVIWACIIILFILIGIMTFSFVHDILEDHRAEKRRWNRK